MNFFTCNNLVNLTLLNNAFNISTFILSHLEKSNILDIERDISKCISIQTAWIQTWLLAHRSHICCANLMTSSVSSVITTMVLKEIDIDMRNKIVKIKIILERPDHHYKLWGHLLDWREWDISYLDIQSATVCNRIL